MQEKLLNLQEAALSEIKDMQDIEQVESLRVKYLGKKGEITAILKEMGKLSAEERPVIGKVANEVREAINDAITRRKKN
ncbi:aminoacyl tRNA synthetase class II, N-terminal domain protein [[Clostridium] sordellii ATCC 9714]|nr:aminoacyl tRNA synthetase class II, N-terminal domain protein [[Clostridium] sordellii ATCC 9714] [Paeniclostridium sordellii ATCC 9714]